MIRVLPPDPLTGKRGGSSTGKGTSPVTGQRPRTPGPSAGQVLGYGQPLLL